MGDRTTLHSPPAATATISTEFNFNHIRNFNNSLSPSLFSTPAPISLDQVVEILPLQRLSTTGEKICSLKPASYTKIPDI